MSGRHWLSHGSVVLCVAAWRRRVSRRAGRSTSFRDQVYVERESGPLEADVYMPHGEGPFPAMLVVHGGAWAMGTRAQLGGDRARRSPKHGYTRRRSAIGSRRKTRSRRRSTIARRPCAGCASTRASSKSIRTASAASATRPAAIWSRCWARWTTTTSASRACRPMRRARGCKLVVAGGAPCDFRVLPADSNRLCLLARRHARREAGRLPRRVAGQFRHGRRSADVFLSRRATTSWCRSRSPQRMVDEAQAARRAGRDVR